MASLPIKYIGCSVFVAALLVSGGCSEDNIPEKDLQTKRTVAPSVETTEPAEDFLRKDPSSQTQESEKAKPIADIYLNTNPKSEPQQGAFNCDDQIFLNIKFANHQPKLHQINIDWIDPNGTEREKNSFPFFVTEKESLAWASLKLHRSVGAGMLQWVNPAAGMEEFIGEWTVNVTVSDLLTQQLSFEVLC